MAVALKKVAHLIDEQYTNEQEMLSIYKEGNYTYNNPYVVLNPYKVVPLAAVAMFDTEEEVAVTVTVKGKEEAGDISHTYKAAKEHVLPVLGLYGDYNNTVVLSLSNGLSHTFNIQTAPLCEKAMVPTKIETTKAYMEDNLMFISPTGKAYCAAYDYEGECRWYLADTFVFDIKRIKNGHFLIGSQRFLEKPYTTTGVVEMDMVGKMYKEYRLPGGYHHDQLEMEDGNIMILTQDFERGTIEDLCVLVDRNTGEIIKKWDMQKVLPQEIGKSGSWTQHDWFHNNAVWYDKKTHSLSFSGRHQDIIINIDYETSELNWILGNPDGWPQEMVDKYFFTPVGDGEFDWQYEQHACLITPEGDVMCFDNGQYRAKRKEDYIKNGENFSRGVRYKIDTENMTIEQVWQYGKERGGEFFSPYICNVEYYADGHYLVHSGGIVMEDGQPTENLMLSAVSNSPSTTRNSITVEVLNDEVMFEMQVPCNYYRAEKMPLYHEGANLELGKGEILGTLGVSEEFLTEVPGLTDEGNMVPEAYKAHFTEEIDRIVFNAEFQKGQLVMLLLEGEEKTYRYYVPTTEKTFTAICVASFQQDMKRTIMMNVMKEGIKGTFNIAVVIDDEKFQTGITVTL
ncbi:MAG: aryl-sulfate sulfotransferase [Cellulosilyticaceae bacterium]